MEIAAQKSVSHADVLKRKFPIAPDGFIPNSVIRKIIRPSKPEPVRQPSPWKLKPVTLIPTVEEEEWKSLHGSVSVASDSEIVTRAFVWDESDEEIEESFEDEIPVSAPPTRKQVTIVTPIGEVSAKKEITPVTIAKPEEQPVVSKAKIQVAPSKAGKEPTKKSGRRKKKKPVSTIDEEESMLPDEEKVRGLLDEIAEEVWFPQDVDMDLESVLSALLSLKQGAVSPPVYKQICNYLVRIQSELGYTAEQLDTVINELVTDLSNISGVIRCYATRTLGDLGMDRKTILMGLLPNLIDKEQSVRQETSQALTRLTGIENKDSLLALLKNIGSLKQDEVGTKEDAGGVLASLSERVTAVSKPVSYDTERIGSWVQHLAVTPGGEADELFEEQVLEADGSVKVDTKRSKGLESQGRVSIDSKRPGIPASVSKPGRDFERFKTQHARAPGERLSDEDLMYEDETYVTEVTIDGAELQHLRRGDVTGKMVYDQAGNLVYVETGKPVYDEMGKPIYDETGKLIYDKTGDQLPIPGGSPHRLRISQYSPSPFALSKEAYGRSYEGEPFYSSMSKSDHFLKTDLVSVHSSTSQLSSWSKGPYDKKLLPHNEELYSTYRKQDVMLSGAQLKTISDTEKPESPHEAAAAGAIKADDKVDKIPAASADGPKSYAGELKFTTVGKDSKRPTGTPVYLESGATPELGSLRFYNQQQARKGSLLMGIDSSGQAAAVVQSSESKSFKKEDDEQNTAQRQGILKQRLLGTGDLNQIVESDTGVGTDLESEMLSVSFEPGAQLLEQHRRDGRLMLEEETVDGHIIVNITVQSNDEFSFEDSGLVSSDDSSSYHAKAENWRSFFDHPSSQERRKSRRESANEGMRDKSVLPPIRYIGEECKLVPADVGVRLLHSVTVQSKLKEKPEDADRKNYRIDALPGRLSVHTNADDSGYSKYGVLKMHWTTKMPSSLAENPYKTATSSSRRSKYPTPGKHCRHDANFSELSKLKHSKEKDILMADYVRDPFLKPALLKEKSQRDAFLPDIPAKPPAYEWDEPLQPPLQSESVKHSREYVTKNHDYYCQYSRLVKKKMHHHISISRYLKNIELAQNILNGLMLMKGK